MALNLVVKHSTVNHNCILSAQRLLIIANGFNYLLFLEDKSYSVRRLNCSSCARFFISESLYPILSHNSSTVLSYYIDFVMVIA